MGCGPISGSLIKNNENNLNQDQDIQFRLFSITFRKIIYQQSNQAIGQE